LPLSTRKEKILKAVVTDYVENCQPVSSQEIQNKYFPEVSSATIRGDMATLEELGYLAQPHTSAGRVPTAEGYRMYVDKLMPSKKLSSSELKIINQTLKAKAGHLEDVVRSAARLISEITNLTAVGFTNASMSDKIKSIKIVKIADEMALFVVVTDRTVLKDAIAQMNMGISEEYLSKAGEFLTSVFGGVQIADVIDVDKFAAKVREEYEKIYKALIKILKEYGTVELENLAIEGAPKLLQHPEYSNVKKAKAMLELLDAKSQLYPILKSNNMNISIKIGHDNEIAEGLPECAVVTATYEVDGVAIGNAGVIGPMRMDYSKVISVLDYIGKTITNLGEDAQDE